MNMKQQAELLIVALLAALALSPAALAQHGEGRGQGHGRGHDVGRGGPSHQWHGNIARFHDHDWGVWRGGHWSHARHDGRLGWWWVVGPSWYYYPAPVYPYPSPWLPSEVFITGPGGAVPMPPTQFWYYCPASRNYYPYVNFCPGGWRQVPATPDAVAPAPVPRVP
jgi:hypothetical protein